MLIVLKFLIEKILLDLDLLINVLNDKEKKEFIDNKIKEYNNVFDVALVGNCDYEPIIDILKKII